MDAINDLMAYRYFIAVNNPIVQELELLEYQDFYQGCFKIYDTWNDMLGEDKVPMMEYSLRKKRDGR